MLCVRPTCTCWALSLTLIPVLAPPSARSHAPEERSGQGIATSKAGDGSNDSSALEYSIGPRIQQFHVSPSEVTIIDAGTGDVGPAEESVTALGARLATGACSLTKEFLSTGIEPEGDTPIEAAFTVDGSKIVVAHVGSQNLIVFDAKTRDVLQAIPLSGSPNSLALSSDGIHAVTANIFEDTASVVDLTTGSELAVVPVGDQPGIVRITPDSTTAVVGNTLDGTLSIIDIATDSELLRVPGAAFSTTVSGTFESGALTQRFSGFEIATDNRTVILPDRFHDRLQFFDIDAGTVVSVPSAPNPVSVAISADGTTAVIGHGFSTRLVSVVDLATHSISKTIPIGADLETLRPSIAINPAGTKAVVPLLNSARVVNLVSGAVSGDLATGCCLSLDVTADGRYCFAGGYRGSLISFATDTIVANLNDVMGTDFSVVSPTGPRAVSLSALVGENVLVFNTDGAAGFLEEIVPSGPPPEGDGARTAAVTPDGSRAVVVNILSDTVTVLDLHNRSADAIVPVGNRPAGVAVTPDSSRAVVANLESSFVSVIDLSALTVTNVDISRFGAAVEISPDGHFAYISTVGGTHGVWRVDLNSLFVDGPVIPTGFMGVVGFIYQQLSGMTLSHDGTTILTCNSLANNVSIIDTGSWTELARVPVGALPARAVFSRDDSVVYVSNADSDTVSIIRNAGGASSVIKSIAVGDRPFEMAITPDGATLFVANGADSSISVVDTATSSVANNILLPLEHPSQILQGIHLDSDGRLYAATGAWRVSIVPGTPTEILLLGNLYVIDPSDGTILGQIDTGLPPAMLAFSDAEPLAVIPSPHGDGVTLVSLDCAEPEACCMRDGRCVDAQPDVCLLDAGTPQGTGTACTTAQACCIDGGTNCLDIDPLCCTELGGVTQGAGSACRGDANGDGIDDVCLQLGACCDSGSGLPGGATCSATPTLDCDCPTCIWYEGRSCQELEDDGLCLLNAIPAVSEWGLAILALLFLIGAKLYFGRRAPASA